MTKKSLSVLALALGVGAGFGSWLAVTQVASGVDVAREATPERSQAAPEKVAADAAFALQWQQARLERQRSEPLQPATAESEAEPEPEELTEPTGPEPLGGPAGSVATVVGMLEDAMAEQPRDPAFEASVLADASEAVGSLGTATTLRRVECASFCRAELSHDSAETRDDDVDHLTELPPFDTNGFVHTHEDDAGKSTVYFAKRGESLPI